ncbi:hypothetical protein LLH06_08935 [Mucilaginibacter daejeonensis]|uniref:DUF6683 family protein n=1 Tax=Mucilaginibacter daejeonensis TaxID=398049 RepID=UPI001D177948|nr:DUF6683 family protein [Mucilaginibacter daejeonensis]UEG55086.1 hypothetical protein LLH06_08935 [Mucilaginibacter daejeonensis]
MNKCKRSLRLIATVAIASIAGFQAKAQQSVDLIMDNFTSSVISQTNVQLSNIAIRSAMRNANAKKAVRGSASAPVTKVNLAYTPTKDLQDRTFQELVTKLKTRDANAASAVNNALGAGRASYDQLFGQMVKESGLPANNAATAMAAYLEIAYAIVNNVTDQSSITPAMDKALQRQTATLLNKNTALTSPTAVAQLGEQLKLQAVVLYLGWQSTLKNGQFAQFRSNIDQQFKGMGFDLSKVSLTAQGFKKKA